MGHLNVSFEVKYSPNNVVMKDGIQFVDAADTNYLTGMAVVWTPAYDDANALEMVAEATNADSEIDIVAENTSNEGDEKEVPENIEATVTAEEQDIVEETVAEEAPVEEKEKPVEEGEVTAEDANAEILHHSVTVTESVEQNGDGEPPVHIVETRECVVETVEPEPDYPRIVAEKDARIAELEGQIAELSQMKAEYEQMKAAQAAAELAAKQAKARAFAQKQGLNVEATEVAEAIEHLNYEAIASFVMAQEEPAEQAPDNTVTLASYSVAGMEIKSKYGDVLDTHD